jgi:hypothetical protein
LAFKMSLQPFTTVQADLNMIWKPCLQSYVHEPEVFVKEELAL